jgi:beta-phosphoglucomutase-like phosphatase (HAD superfamily)
MTQAVRRQTLAAESCVCLEDTPSGVCGGQNVALKCFFNQYFVSTLSVLFLTRSINFLI